MPSPAFFTSARERRLWGWALASVAAVYGTLGMAGRLAGLLGESGLGAGLFVLASLLVLAAVVTQPKFNICGLRLADFGGFWGVVCA